jgi:uncharacterized protein with von Willebrand factor type A (vWA) domain
MPDPVVPAADRDLAALAVAFGDLLHRAGLPTTPERAGRFAQAVGLAAPATVEDLYWVARVTFVTGEDQLDTFDRVFDQVFRGTVDPADSRGDPNAPPPAHVRHRDAAGPPGTRRADDRRGALDARPALAHPGDGPGDDDAPSREALLAVASSEERLATTDFAILDERELAELAVMMRRLKLTPPMRPGRRPRRHPSGDDLDLRATLARARRNGGDPVEQVRRRRQPRARRIVVLCDISGSMETYARAYVQFLHAVARAGGARAEVFTFATRLTRLTRALRVAQPQVALARASAAAPDWSGGTRIGEAMKHFLDDYGRRGLARGAVVVIVSDGWERDDPALLAEQMARLHRLAHRVVWVNPRRSDPRYEPLTGGMAAALPYCDAFVSGHTLRALDEVVEAVAAE